jgi:hypothetical protein
MQSQIFKLLLLAFSVGACADAAEEPMEELGTAEQAITVTLEFRDGGLPVETGTIYSGTRDARLVSGSPDTVFGNNCLVAGSQSGNEQSCVIMFFDLRNYIPASAAVQSAILYINVTDPSVDPVDVSVLSRHWKETDVTWNKFTALEKWGAPGAKSSSDRGLPFKTFTARFARRVGIDLGPTGVAKIQEALSLGNSAVNGFILSNATTGDPLGFDGSEHRTRSRRPSLSVTYIN